MNVIIGMNVRFTVVSTNGKTRHLMAAGALESHCANVMDELLKLEEGGCGIDSSAVSVDTRLGAVEIDLRALGTSFEEAQHVGQSAMRSAIHAAGGVTPDWLNMQSSNSELVQSAHQELAVV